MFSLKKYPVKQIKNTLFIGFIAWLFSGCMGDATQEPDVPEKKLALEMSVVSESVSYMDIGESNVNPYTKDGYIPYGEGEGDKREEVPVDTLLKYAIAPPIERTQQMDTKLYEDGTVEIIVSNIESDADEKRLSNVPKDPNEREIGELVIKDGHSVLRDKEGNVLMRETIEMPLFKELVDSAKAEIARGDTPDSKPGQALTDHALSLFGIAPQTKRGVAFLMDAEKQGAKIEKLHDDIVSVTYKGLDQLGIINTASLPSGGTKNTPFSDAQKNVQVKMYYDTGTDRNLGIEFMSEGKPTARVKYIYEDQLTSGQDVTVFDLDEGMNKTKITTGIYMENFLKDVHGKDAKHISSILYKSIKIRNHLNKGGSK